MKYFELHNYLKKAINYDDREIIIDDKVIVQNYNFESAYRFLLPGGTGNQDPYEYCTASDPDYEPDIIQAMLNKSDAEIMENIKFRYHIFRPKGDEKCKQVILLFHGFNEKYWAKYLTWAKKLVDETGKAVVLFPIAFHMNRAPVSWSESRQMFNISQQRKERHPDVLCSTLSNVAISTRLHNKPQRFIWSGLQTYYDVIDFVENIKADLHPAIDKDATIDFFSYSIGSFLAEILMMTNKNGYFSDSKLCMFCGGAVFNRLSPVSKFILDSEANVSLYSYVVEHLESHMRRDELLRHYLGEAHPEGINFRSMLNYKCLTEYREAIFRAMSHRILAVTLAKDTVVPAYEIINTLQGVRRDIPIEVDIHDFPYPYKHEDPFPALTSIADSVDQQFNSIMNRMCDFLKAPVTSK
ncbi:DUF6051 family protein [uncultured Bacteroides sp.]|uniref:DUF6051 family protein n=1 Tax=uncultured Bacteroides sp. TaxID=162156 RepID=UPI002AABAD2B|nr:DUF6051 family protein [uncultured Bacteroides sp.]